MLAAYAFSNIVIYSLIAIKLNYKMDEKMDLYIRSTACISDALLASIRSVGVFENIYLVEMPDVVFKSKSKILAPFRYINYYKLYRLNLT